MKRLAYSRPTLTFSLERDQPRLWPFSADTTAANIAARPTAASERRIVLGDIECKPHELATTADILHRIAGTEEKGRGTDANGHDEILRLWQCDIPDAPRSNF